jgi:hypothetical protein
LSSRFATAPLGKGPFLTGLCSLSGGKPDAVYNVSGNRKLSVNKKQWQGKHTLKNWTKKQLHGRGHLC